jgi:hypothetical protein
MTVSTETRASCRNLRRTTPPPNATALITPTPQTAEPRCGVGRRHDVRQIHWPASRLQAAGKVPELSVEPSMEAQREAAHGSAARSRRDHRAAVTRHSRMSWKITAPALTKEEREVIVQA